VTILHTCSYRAWRPELGQPVRTSLGKPKWLLPEAASWPVLWEATPRSDYFDASAAEFDRRYIGQLERYGARRIARRLGEIAHQTGAGVLLLCCFRGRARAVPPLPVQRLLATGHRRTHHRTGGSTTMIINGRKLKIQDGTITWRGRQYPLAGAVATYDEQRRGIPGLSRRTIATVTIRGDGWAITGRAGSHGFWLRRAVDNFNEQASTPAT
jgi:hypothetical protein